MAPRTAATTAQPGNDENVPAPGTVDAPPADQPPGGQQPNEQQPGAPANGQIDGQPAGQPAGADTQPPAVQPTPNPLEQSTPTNGEPPRLEIRKIAQSDNGQAVEREYLVAHLPMPVSVPTLSPIEEMQVMIKEGRWPASPVEQAQLLAEMAQRTLTTGAVESYSADHRRYRALAVWRELDSMSRSLRRVVDEMIEEFNAAQPAEQRVAIDGDGQMVLSQNAIQSVQQQPHKPQAPRNSNGNGAASSNGGATREDTRYATYDQTIAWAKHTLGIDRLFVTRRYTPRENPDQAVTVYLEWAGPSRWVPAAWDSSRGRVVAKPWNAGDPAWTTLNAADQALVEGSPVSVYAAYLVQVENDGKNIPQHPWNEAKRGGVHNILVQLRIIDELARAFHSEK